MSGFFFGPAEEELFGYYHAPLRGDAGAVVICAPWGLEYQYSHRALRVLGQRLAACGYHALRFDYSGTGDSWGDTTDADLERWEQDLQLAVRELQKLSGRTRIDLVGLRLGAVVAASTARVRGDVGRVVLWDPVLDGEAWVQEMSGRAPALTPHEEDATSVALGPYRISPRLREQLRFVGPSRFGPELAEQILLLETAEPALSARPSIKHIQNLHYEFLADTSPWIEDIAIWAGQIPAKAVRRISEWFLR